jgi:hypothetical protein
MNQNTLQLKSPVKISNISLRPDLNSPSNHQDTLLHYSEGGRKNDEPLESYRSAACTFNPNFKAPACPPENQKKSIYSDDEDDEDSDDEASKLISRIQNRNFF